MEKVIGDSLLFKGSREISQTLLVQSCRKAVNCEREYLNKKENKKKNPFLELNEIFFKAEA